MERQFKGEFSSEKRNSWEHSKVIEFFQEMFFESQKEKEQSALVCSNPCFFENLKASEDFFEKYEWFCSALEKNGEFSDFEATLLIKIHLKASLLQKTKEKQKKAQEEAYFFIQKSFLDLKEALMRKKGIEESSNCLEAILEEEDQRRIPLRHFERIALGFWDFLVFFSKLEKNDPRTSFVFEFPSFILGISLLFVQVQRNKRRNLEGTSCFLVLDHLRDKYYSIISIGVTSLMILQKRTRDLFIFLLKIGSFKKTGKNRDKTKENSSQNPKSSKPIEKSLMILARIAAMVSDDMFFLFYKLIFSSLVFDPFQASSPSSTHPDHISSVSSTNPQPKVIPAPNSSPKHSWDSLFINRLQKSAVSQFPRSLFQFYGLDDLLSSPMGLECVFSFLKLKPLFQDQVNRTAKLMIKRYFTQYDHSSPQQSSFLNYLLQIVSESF